MKNLKKFGIIFAVSFVILGIIALFACGFVADTVCGIFNNSSKNLDNSLSPAETTPTDEADERLSKKVDGKSFTWLWVVSDYRPEVFDDYYPADEAAAKKLGDFGTLGKSYRLPSATNIILVRGFVDTREYFIMTIPSVTRISTSAGDYTLGDYYAVSGTSGLVSKVEAMTGLKVDYYSVIHSTDLSEIANAAGSIECKLPVSIYTDGKNYVSAPPAVTTSKDETTAKKADDKKKETSDKEETTAPLTNELDRSDSVKLAKKLMPALLYYDPTDGIEQEMTIEQSFATGLMNNLSDKSDTALQSILSSLSDTFVSSNLKTEAIYLHGEVIRAFSWFELHVSTYPGKFVVGKGGNAAYYKANIEDGVRYFYNFR